MKKLLFVSFCLVIIVLGTSIPALTKDLYEHYDALWQDRSDLDTIKIAITNLTELVQTNDDPELLWRLGRFYYWFGERAELTRNEKLSYYREGKSYAQKAIEKGSVNPECYYWHGILIGKVGETEGILQSLFMVKPLRDNFEKALSIDDNFAGAYLGLSILYRMVPGWPLCIGNMEKSLELGEKAASLHPENLDTHLNLAEIYLKLKKNDKAKQILEYIVKAPPMKGYEIESMDAKEKANELILENWS